MITIEKLKELGCNTDEGLTRCFGDESFYLGLVPGAFEKERYEKLDKLIKDGNLNDAFEEAHALKGVLANLSITPLFEMVSEITELLRARTETDYSPLIDKMWEIYGSFEAML
ncbi:MAG: Hpt domain-containing protein [Lachnospiraceae bacterium]|nr:Hpt domain-containing protein [Lachnospiraceae bacterium]